MAGPQNRREQKSAKQWLDESTPGRMSLPGITIIIMNKGWKALREIPSGRYGISMPQPNIVVMNGINLNMFGQRDPAQYGTATLDDINSGLRALAGELSLELEFFQSNCEGAFVEKIHAVHHSKAAGMLINAGAWTHYSYGLMDALAILTIPVVEVHMSNPHAREEFRHFSVVSKVARGVIAGFGADSYLLALRAVANLIR